MGMRHPAIVSVHGVCASGSQVWIVMELCKGGCVESYVARCGAFGETLACKLFAQLLQGVNYLHSKRVVHRDLKPANLFLMEDTTTLRIIDFNSAARIGARSDSVMLTDRGTHLYSAPELRCGRLWNERVDIWGCGVCLDLLSASVCVLRH